MSWETIFLLVTLAVVGVFTVATWKTHSEPSVCPSCGTQGNPATETRGSIFIEIILWLCFIIPGLIYSIWRMNNRHKVCRACGSNVIPLSSPRGQQIAKSFR